MTRATPPDAPVTVGGRPRPLADRDVVRVVTGVLRGERRAARISVAFLGREAMRRLHAAHLGHDRPTDVLAFALPGDPLTGDLYLCPWVAARQARRFGVSLRQEVVRLLVHGTLHVLGYDHPEGDARTRSPMWRRQERYVAALA